MIDDPSLRPWLVLGVICLVNCLAVAIANFLGNPLRLRRIITINMMMVVSFGTLLGQFGPMLTNYGVAWYATVIGAQVVILDRYGRLAASETIAACYMAVTLALLCTFPLTYAPVLPGNDAGAAVIVLAQHRPQVLIAAYAALGPALAVIDIVYSRLRQTSRFLAVVTAVGIAQAVDTVIFFPIAFGDSGVEFVITAAISGLILKIPMTLAIVAAGMAVSWVVSSPTSQPIPRQAALPKRPASIRSRTARDHP